MAEFKETVLAMVQQGVDHSARQMAVLLLVADAANDGDREVRVLATKLVVSRPAITRAADRLEDEGLLSRLQAKEDRRLVRLVLTAAGRKFVERLHKGFPAPRKPRPAPRTSLVLGY